MFLKNKLK